MKSLSEFIGSGIYRFQDSKAVFIDPVRVMNRSYTRFRVSPSAYYSRFFEAPVAPNHSTPSSTSTSRKRKRKLSERKPARPLNERERIADQRHQEARPLLLKAHDSLLKCTELLEALPNLRNELRHSSIRTGSLSLDGQHSLVELGRLWQAPLFEITLNVRLPDRRHDDDCTQEHGQRVVPTFNNLVANESQDDAEAELMEHRYIMPRQSCFYMVCANQQFYNADSGFNLIVLDPPWENASARQKSRSVIVLQVPFSAVHTISLLTKMINNVRRYPTLPNRNFLSLPIKQLAHSGGALVALWVTNREKLRTFVEDELFPAWEVTYLATYYWLKVKPNGSLTSDLDLFHHRPYECLLLGFCHGSCYSQSLFRPLKEDQVFISIPGDFSRKPPIGDLLMDYLPMLEPARCIELFAREMMAGWLSWGNEPLHFQHSTYFANFRK